MPFYPAQPEVLAFSRDLLEPYQESQYNRLYVTPYGSNTRHSDDLAAYFLPNAERQITCGEWGSNAAINGTIDVLANYFNVLTAPLPTAPNPITISDYNFQSVVNFAPTQQQVGAAINYRRQLSEYIDEGFWFEAILPIMHVTNNLNLTEQIMAAGGEAPEGYYDNMLSAFVQPAFNFGKIANGPRSCTGIADLQLKLGYTYNKTETHAFATYWGLIIPTGPKPNAEYLFEPIVGNNGHGAIYTGAEVVFRFWHKDDMAMYWAFDTAGIFFGTNKQLRSFDLKGKPWSRYIWVYKNSAATATSPGINYFTQTMEVAPGSQRDLNTAIIFRKGGFRLEGGYHLFSRAQEDVKLSEEWRGTVGLAALFKDNLDLLNNGGITKDAATINNYANVQNDQNSSGTQVFRPISADQIDLNSATMPGTFLNTFYGMVYYYWADRRRPIYLGAGGSFDLKNDNAGPAKWSAWCNLGIEF